MSTAQKTQTELAQFRQELDAFRKEFQELRRFLHIESPVAEGKPARLHITCSTLCLHNPDGRQRVFLGVEANEPSLQFQTAGHEQTLLAHAGAETDRGEVVIFDKGRPRATAGSFACSTNWASSAPCLARPRTAACSSCNGAARRACWPWPPTAAAASWPTIRKASPPPSKDETE